ncbi:hypothetical protein PMIN06_002201 [Paraphaeosphaeria minitans]|uniref:Uncharacterized protein n=1 Tax=Paraphaeosphaeria minitans TaxID=565426 RepID=A0A9P6KRH7_9PLEO|nr:hypothetical protein PMIN01_05751 [Paraphaeosphaeria minitans]
MESPCVCPATEPASTQKKEQTKLPAFRVTKPGVKRSPRKLSKALKRPIRPDGKASPVKIKADGLVDVKNPPSDLVAE